jgi:hypothetical protein
MVPGGAMAEGGFHVPLLRSLLCTMRHVELSTEIEVGNTRMRARVRARTQAPVASYQQTI